MTVEELWDKLDKKLEGVENKLDTLAHNVATHDVEIKKHSVEYSDFREFYGREHDKLETRITKLERWMWIALGAGGTAGAGVVKLLGA